MRLPVKRLVPEAQIPEYKTAGAAAFDFTTIESKILEPGQIHRFRTGLVMCVPRGHVLIIASRSSNAVKKGIAIPNGIGVIDSDFCGENDELLLCIQNITNVAVTITAGERLAQGVIIPIPSVEFCQVTQTGTSDRGGWGSTGR